MPLPITGLLAMSHDTKGIVKNALLKYMQIPIETDI